MELLIQSEKNIFAPSILDGMQWKTELMGSPGKLTFSIRDDKTITIQEGNVVRLTDGEDNLFYGFVFAKPNRMKDGVINITAYDQLRYLKNKDTYAYKKKRADQVIRMIAEDFHLNVGELAQTTYRIPKRIESNVQLFDIILTALDLELRLKNKLFVLYDDFGHLTLRDAEELTVDSLIDPTTAQNFDFSSDIDRDTYNKIKLIFENEKTGKLDVYIAKDNDNINRWGVLQYSDTLQEGENGKAKADALLNLYNAKRMELSVSDAFGDNRVRAGRTVFVNLPDVVTPPKMLVKGATHTWKNGEHWMTLELIGGNIG